MESVLESVCREPWNKGKLIRHEPPLKPLGIWALRAPLRTAHQARKLVLFNLSIDSKLRGCDLVSPRVRNAARGGQMLHRTMVMQHKAQRPVQFEVPEPTRDVLAAGIAQGALKSDG